MIVLCCFSLTKPKPFLFHVFSWLILIQTLLKQSASMTFQITSSTSSLSSILSMPYAPPLSPADGKTSGLKSIISASISISSLPPILPPLPSISPADGETSGLKSIVSASISIKLTSIVQKVQLFFSALRALSCKEIQYGSYATSEQVTSIERPCPIVMRIKWQFEGG